MPSRVNAQARGLVKLDTAGSAPWKRSLARLVRPGSVERPTTVPSAHSARPWLSSEPIASIHCREYDMKFRNRPARGVEGVADEGQVARGERAEIAAFFRAGVLDQGHQQQRASVVVEAVAVVVTRDAERGVLEHPRAVGHEAQMGRGSARAAPPAASRGSVPGTRSGADWCARRGRARSSPCSDVRPRATACCVRAPPRARAGRVASHRRRTGRRRPAKSLEGHARGPEFRARRPAVRARRRTASR